MVSMVLAAVERLPTAGVGGPDAVVVVAAARSLLLESLSPFEMTHRLYRESNTALRRLNEALEEQSRHIARALHDNTNQLVASMGLAIAALEREPDTKRARLAELRIALEEISDELRRASHELRPPALDDLGVIPALEHFVRGLSGLVDVDVHFFGSTGGRLPSLVETTLFRVAQEALTNVAKHAGALHVWVSLQRQPSAITCVVHDDGRGFVPDAVAGCADRGLGLISIRERVDALGGSLDIRSTPGAGTTVTARLPSGGAHADPGTACR
jgi:signal transduction histidine kinase